MEPRPAASPDFETPLASVEARLDEVAADAAAARHLAAARDRDIADLGVKVEANRAAINALGEQTRARFDLIDQRFEQIDRNFLEVRGKLDQTDAGQERSIALLDQLIEHGDSGE